RRSVNQNLRLLNEGATGATNKITRYNLSGALHFNRGSVNRTRDIDASDALIDGDRAIARAVLRIPIDRDVGRAMDHGDRAAIELSGGNLAERFIEDKERNVGRLFVVVVRPKAFADRDG